MSEMYWKNKLAFMSANQNNYNGTFVVSKKITLNIHEISGNYWVLKASGGTNRSLSSSFSLDGFGYNCAGVGVSTTFLNEVNQYNDNLNVWVIKSDNGTVRSNLSAFSLMGFGYVCGGGNGVTTYINEINKYNPYTNIWSNKSAFTVKRMATAIGLNGYGYSCCGTTTGSVLMNLVEKYDEFLDTWTIASSSRTPKRNLTGFIIGNNGYICNGYDTVANNEIEQYNETTKLWDLKIYSSSGSTNSVGMALNNYGYLCLGNTNSTLQYNELSNICTYVASSLSNRDEANGFSLNGLGYLCNGLISGTQSNDVNQYRNINLQKIFGSLKISKKIPKIINVSTNLNGFQTSLPVALATNTNNGWTVNYNNQWIYGETNKPDTFLKTGWTLSQLVSASNISGTLYNYEIQVGIPSMASSVSAFPVSGGGYPYRNSAGNYWSTLLHTMTNKCYQQTFNYNGYIYSTHGGLGTSTTFTNETNRYNDSTNIWTNLITTGTTARRFPSSFSLNGFGYITNGNTTGTTYVTEHTRYFDELNIWTTQAVELNSRYAAGGLSLSQYGYVAGGWVSTYVSSVTRYIDSINIWVSVKPLSTARYSIQGQTFYTNSFGYIAGGYVATYSAVVEQYEHTINWWTTKTSITTAKLNACAFNLNNEGYIAAGYSGSFLNETQKYNESQNIWLNQSNSFMAFSEGIGSSLNGFGYGFTGMDSTGLKQMFHKFTPQLPIPILSVSLYVEE